MKIKICLVSFLTMMSILCACAQPKVNASRQLKLAVQQYKNMLASLPDTKNFPQSTNADGSLKTMKSDWWCSGFFGGSLWYLYEATKNASLKAAAAKWTEAVEKEQYNTSTHDLGFMLYSSYGNGYRLTANPSYRVVLLHGAASLASRFNPNVGLIKSWDKMGSYSYPHFPKILTISNPIINQLVKMH